MDKGLKFFERIIIYALLAMMAIVILLSTIDLGRLLVIDIISSETYLLSVTQLLEIFGFILLIIIGVELFETIKAYLVEHVVHIEIVLEVALIAIARKVIILDVKELSPGTLYGIAGVVLALSIGYYLERRARKLGKWIESKLEE